MSGFESLKEKALAWIADKCAKKKKIDAEKKSSEIFYLYIFSGSKMFWRKKIKLKIHEIEISMSALPIPEINEKLQIPAAQQRLFVDYHLY